jgi:hypothetical protein
VRNFVRSARQQFLPVDVTSSKVVVRVRGTSGHRVGSDE